MRSDGQAEGLKLVTEEADGSETLYRAAEKTDVPNLEIDAASRTTPTTTVSATGTPYRRRCKSIHPMATGFTRAFDETIRPAAPGRSAAAAGT